MTPVDVGASLSGSSSAGASHSGALGIDVRGGGNYGGTTYGPGSLVQASGFGTSTGGGLNWPLILVIGAVVLAAWYFIRRRS